MKTSTEAAPTALNVNRFQAFKVSLCGNQLKRDFKTGLTLEQARAYPIGKQTDSEGTFIWTYSVTDDWPSRPASNP
jgi:hypothetical protein